MCQVNVIEQGLLSVCQHAYLLREVNMKTRRLNWIVFAVVAAIGALAFGAAMALATPFAEIRLGDIDGLGYGTGAGYFGAPGGPANVDGLGVLGNGDFIPDLNLNGILATHQGDDFDNRSAAEIAGGFVTGSGFFAAGASSGSQFTDIALSTSFDNTFPPPNDFPTPPSSTRPNQPGFVFDFMVAGGDIIPGIPLFLNVIFGDYDVVPAELRVTPVAGPSFIVPLSVQPAGQDGLIQAAFAIIAFGDVFVPVGSDWQGHVEVDFVAPNEPYTTFDFAEVSVESIVTARRVKVDVKPQSCPNPLNVKFKGSSMISSARTGNPTGAGGVLPAAVLGSTDFNVTDIDPSSVMLEGVAPIRWALQDVATPVVTDPNQECECTTDGPDGIDDLTLKFSKTAVIDAIGAVNNGDEIVLTLTGTLLDGTAFEGADCVLIRAEKTDFVNTSLTAGAGGEFAAWSYPNPFNAATTIGYRLVEDGHVSLVVYNVLGQEVTTLVNEDQSVGEYSVLWSGRDASGREVASGMYFYRIQVGSDWLTRKMTLLK
jgi:hypothetical protein